MTVAFDFQSNSYVQVLAFLHGIQLCIHFGLTLIQEETNSQLYVQMLRNETQWPWSFLKVFVRIQGLMHQPSFQIGHIYHEGNMVVETNSISQ